MKKLFLILFTWTLLSAELYSPKDFSYLLSMKDFDASLLKMHFTLYEGYVKNCNLLQKLLSELAKKEELSAYEYGAFKRRFGWEFDGMRLHELYFSNLGGRGILPKKSSLYKAITAQFGSFEAWRKEFAATGLIRGIGWVILYLDLASGNLFNVWINEHDVGHLARGEPIVVMDVWEHAYLTQFGLNRGEYIEKFLQNIDWGVALERFDSITVPLHKNGRSQ